MYMKVPLPDFKMSNFKDLYMTYIYTCMCVCVCVYTETAKVTKQPPNMFKKFIEFTQYSILCICYRFNNQYNNQENLKLNAYFSLIAKGNTKDCYDFQAVCFF